MESLIFQIIDEKSLIKKYQREIMTLKLELDQVKKGVVVGVNLEEIMSLKQQVFLRYFCYSLVIFTCYYIFPEILVLKYKLSQFCLLVLSSFI